MKPSMWPRAAAAAHWGRPVRLGLSQVMPASLAAALHAPYDQASDWQKALEREAYANQHDLGLGLVLLERHCRHG